MEERNLIQQENGKILVIDALGIQKIINPISFLEVENQNLFQNEVFQAQENEKEVNIKW